LKGRELKLVQNPLTRAHRECSKQKSVNIKSPHSDEPLSG